MATQQLQRGDGVRKRSDNSSDSAPANPQILSAQQGSDGRSDAKKEAVSASAAQHHGRRGHERPHDHGILTSLGIGRGGEKDREPKVKEPLGFQSKQLEETQWLEMVDGKHRYESNMKWVRGRSTQRARADARLQVLPQGVAGSRDQGQLLSVVSPHSIWPSPVFSFSCPASQAGPQGRQGIRPARVPSRTAREGADNVCGVVGRERPSTDSREHYRYLSAEQRLNYLVLVGDDGQLRWAHNDELVGRSRINGNRR